MKKIIKSSFLSLTVITMCCLIPFSSCEDDDPNIPDLVGTFTWEEWQTQSGWKDHSASDFTPDSAIVEEMKTFLQPGSIWYTFELYGSNWCHADCEPQMPRIIKFLKDAGVSVNYENIKIYGLDRTKTEPADAMAKWKEAFPNENCYVPTLVIYVHSDDSMPPKAFKVKCETTDFPEWQNKILEAMKY
jgi:hypothetical protein